MTLLRDRVSAFYDELERLSCEYDDITDTDVREALHETLTYYFVWGLTTARMPRTYYMLTASGDSAVAEAVERFLSDAVAEAGRDGIPVGDPRLRVLQDSSIVTAGGEHYDLFIGHADLPLVPVPLNEMRFEPGDYSDD